MKRTIALMMALALLAAGAALAEPEALLQDAPMRVDLDGDGAPETVEWTMTPGEYEPQLTVSVTPEGGAPQTYVTDILWGEQVFVADLDGDGRREILATGDEMSDDYLTYCLRYDRGQLYELLFPDADRGEFNQGYALTGYGEITAIDGNRLTLSGSQDVLGTHWLSRTFTLTPAERFEFADDGLWVRDVDLSDEEIWEFSALTLIVPVSYYSPDDVWGDPIGTLYPGDKLLLVGTDKREMTLFTARSGATGALRTCRDEERGWGMLVDDLPEDQVFESLPYAD